MKRARRHPITTRRRSVNNDKKRLGAKKANDRLQYRKRVKSISGLTVNELNPKETKIALHVIMLTIGMLDGDGVIK